MITQLNVINVFTDEFDQIKAEGKSIHSKCLNILFAMSRCHCAVQLHDGAEFDDEWGDVDPHMYPWLHRAVHASRLHLLQAGELGYGTSLHGPLKL